jgi:hypothetical protein
MSASKHGKISRKQRKVLSAAICEQIKEGVTVLNACQSAGISYNTFRNWQRQDVDILAMYNEADDVVTQRLIDVGVKHSAEGTTKGIYYKGQLVASETEYDHTLLMRMIEARDKRYAQRNKVELTGADGGPIEFKQITITFSNDPRDFIDHSEYTPPGDAATNREKIADQERAARDAGRETDSEG